MSERVLVVIEKEPGCTCQDISRVDEGLVLGSWEFDGGDYEEERCGYEWEPCTHGSTVRLATTADLESLVTPARAAKVLGLSAEDLTAAESTMDGGMFRLHVREAARRVRESAPAAAPNTPTERSDPRWPMTCTPI